MSLLPTTVASLLMKVSPASVAVRRRMLSSSSSSCHYAMSSMVFRMRRRANDAALKAVMFKRLIIHGGDMGRVVSVSELASSLMMGYVPKRTFHSTAMSLMTSNRHKSDGDDDSSSSKGGCLSQRMLIKTENIYTLPNALCIVRIALTPAIGHYVLAGDLPLATGLFLIAGFTDAIDGWLARYLGQATIFGAALDPIADKFMMITLTLCLSSSALLPVPLAVLIIGRDALLLGGTAIHRYYSMEPPKTFQRYFDVRRGSVEISPNIISKINTVMQVGLVTVSLAIPAAGIVSGDFAPLTALQWIVAGTTVASGLSYIFDEKAIRYLKHNNITKH